MRNFAEKLTESGCIGEQIKRSKFRNQTLKIQASKRSTPILNTSPASLLLREFHLKKCIVLVHQPPAVPNQLTTPPTALSWPRRSPIAHSHRHRQPLCHRSGSKSAAASFSFRCPTLRCTGTPGRQLVFKATRIWAWQLRCGTVSSWLYLCVRCEAPR